MRIKPITEELAYAPAKQDLLSSRVYGVVGADLSGETYVKLSGFGPEYESLLKVLKKKSKSVQRVGTSFLHYPKEMSALEFMKNVVVKEASELGFSFALEPVFLSLSGQYLDVMRDGTILGVVKKAT